MFSKITLDYENYHKRSLIWLFIFFFVKKKAPLDFICALKQELDFFYSRSFFINLEVINYNKKVFKSRL